MTVHMNWREDIACRDADPDLFFPIGATGAALRQMEEAKRICRACPVQIQCLAWALENGVADGVWGGTTPDERRIIRSLSRRTTNTKADGDDKSYHPAERREHGIRAQAARRKAAGILRRAGIGPDAGGTGANLT
jgi:WhiB family redox-sensing transcriptional regulator